MNVFHLPDLGEGLEDAEIVAWHVNVGDHVVVDQPLLSVETAKAVVEIPAPRSGRISGLTGKVGDIVRTGAPLVTFEGEASGQEDTGTVVGELPRTAGATKPPPAVIDRREATARRSASPAVRELARRLGVDLAGLSGSGPAGAIVRADVESAAAKTATRDGYEPLRGVRRAMALNMARSAREVPGSTVTEELDIGTWPADADVTQRLVRAVVSACGACPALNAWFDGERLACKLWPVVNLGIAMNGPDGLFVPVLRDAGGLSLEEIRAALDAMKRDVAARAILPEALTGATITLSNFGMMGGLHAALAIVPPQVAILGAGRIVEAVRPIEGHVRITRVLPLSLTFDHRVVTGAEAVTFLNAAVGALATA